MDGTHFALYHLLIVIEANYIYDECLESPCIPKWPASLPLLSRQRGPSLRNAPLALISFISAGSSAMPAEEREGQRNTSLRMTALIEGRKYT